MEVEDQGGNGGQPKTTHQKKQSQADTKSNDKKKQDSVMEEEKAIPKFPALTAKELNSGKPQYAKINVPPHRYTPLRENWVKLYEPIAKHMKLQIKFNPKKRCVEMKTSKHTTLQNSLQKSTEFVRAFMLGFEIRDAIALLRLDDLYIDSFEVRDVKSLHGEHLSRAIGRIAGQGGKTKFTIENATKTRIVLADTHIHILGSFNNINTAKRAICNLIMGKPPGKVYTTMRAVASRQKERF